MREAVGMLRGWWDWAMVWARLEAWFARALRVVLFSGEELGMRDH